MRYSTIIAGLILLLLVSSKPVQRGTLAIQFGQLKKVEGTLRVVVFKAKEHFKTDENFVVAKRIAVKHSTPRLLLNDLPFGSYAIKVHHDVNNNDKMDTNFIGIPKEPYGFSNDARGTFGPPSYEDCLFEFTEDQQTISIQVK